MLINMEGNPKKFGFYTTRYVEAENSEAAEQKAVDIIRNDKEFMGVIINEAGDQPMVYLDQLYEVESFENESVPGQGYTFFPERKPWWKIW